jgi:hypothetical protein
VHVPVDHARKDQGISCVDFTPGLQRRGALCDGRHASVANREHRRLGPGSRQDEPPADEEVERAPRH